MRVACGAFARFGSGDVDKIRWREHQSVFSVGDFVVVETEFLAHSQPGVVGEHGDSAVVGVTVDGPVSEEYVGLFGFDQGSEFFVMSTVDDSVPIALRGEDRAGFQNFTGSFRFGHADVGGGLGSCFGTAFLAAIQIQDYYFVALVGVARDGSSAAVFGISWVASRYHHFEFLPWLLGSGGLSERECGGYSQDVSARVFHLPRMTDFVW